MQRLIVLSGLPGAGKTTWANKYVKDHSYKRVQIVSYDNLRIAANGASPERIMEHVFRYVGHTFRTDLYEEIIVDACNIHEHDKVRWEAASWVLGIPMMWVNADTSVELCIERDKKRRTPVGEIRIRAMAVEVELNRMKEQTNASSAV